MSEKYTSKLEFLIRRENVMSTILTKKSLWWDNSYVIYVKHAYKDLGVQDFCISEADMKIFLNDHPK